MASIALYGLRGVTTQLRRSAIPRVQTSLQMYAYRAVLKALMNKGSSASGQGLVQCYYKPTVLKINKANNWTVPVGESAMTREIRNYKLLANCGDYLSLELRRFRYLVNEKSVTGGADAISETLKLIRKKRWSKIAEELGLYNDTGTVEDSSKSQNTSQNPGATNRNPKQDIFSKACKSLGYNDEKLFWTIRSYALRNDTFHNGITVYAEELNWDGMALRISKDLESLPKLKMPEAETEPFKMCIQSIRDRYFKNTKKHSSWVPSEYAKSQEATAN
ncbi:MAG: hypothetical protein M1840_007754 [Geoglossum simile]|nr:MAG: hypothetical protein M1840_007754 [Geoglossum simile]